MQESIWTLMMSAAVFCTTMTMTPGPNNILLTVSGANYGIKRTLPHIMGIRLGQTLLQLIVLLGLGKAFEAVPLLHETIKYLSVAYLIYLACKIAMTESISQKGISRSEPMTLKSATFFQFINPKSWLAVITLSSAFTLTGDEYWFTATLTILTYNLIGFPAALIWVCFGKGIGEILGEGNRRHYFNLLMAASLAMSIPLIVL